MEESLKNWGVVTAKLPHSKQGKTLLRLHLR